MGKVVLAFSGGLDTEIAVHWLKHRRGLDVITFSADLGQGTYLEPLGERAIELGAISAHLGDLKKRFIENYAWPLVRAGASYGHGCLLATALSRPIIAREMVKIAEENGAMHIAHGGKVKGNDQIRFQTAVAALSDSLEVIAPLREWQLHTTEKKLAYARSHGISIDDSLICPYVRDRNLWGVAIEGGPLVDPAQPPPEDIYCITASPDASPAEPEEVAVTFDRGVPVAVNEQEMSPVEIVEKLNELGGKHGVGRTDVIEDRLIGIKSRIVYEAPAATIIYLTHKELESLVLSRHVLESQEIMSRQYGRLVYTGMYFSDLRKGIDTFFIGTQKYVCGTIRARLHKGCCTPIGRSSPHSLYDRSLAATRSTDARLERISPSGFAKVRSLPGMSEGVRERKVFGGRRPGLEERLT